MNRRQALIASGIWTGVGLLGCVLLLALILTHRGTGRSGVALAANVGAGAGVVMTVGYVAIWVVHNATAGKWREEPRKRKPRKKRHRDDD